MEHTKTPWIVGHTSVAGTVIDPADPTDNYGKNIGIICDEIHARRIVAAVNACEGIETEWLEQHKLEFTGKAIDKIHALQAQNARLLEALKSLKRQVTDLLIPAINKLPAGQGIDFPTLIDWSKTVEKVDAAIAEAELTTQTPPKPDESDSFMQRFNSPESGQRLDSMIQKFDATLSRLLQEASE